ncbi:TPA: hypothetical protein ACPP9V_000849 [Haemophilus influenzae]|uniref:hypothetical protein n=2 Tax=Haemophilus influenzae TaxID=727 RepID=UPI001CC5FDD5|nr:hypothetical protein [Haemophilus influenzae]MCK8908842.1 hypothetical protein [Haemophilus influenzae]MCK8927928.1 hypothetical protein [Haemophilus influenzae]
MTALPQAQPMLFLHHENVNKIEDTQIDLSATPTNRPCPVLPENGQVHSLIAVNMREFAILTRLLPALNNSLDFVLNTQKISRILPQIVNDKKFFYKIFSILKIQRKLTALFSKNLLETKGFHYAIIPKIRQIRTRML